MYAHTHVCAYVLAGEWVSGGLATYVSGRLVTQWLVSGGLVTQWVGYICEWWVGYVVVGEWWVGYVVVGEWWVGYVCASGWEHTKTHSGAHTKWGASNTRWVSEWAVVYVWVGGWALMCVCVHTGC